MNEMWLGLAIGFLVSTFVFVTLAYARAGSLQRAWWGLTVAGRANQDPAIQAKVSAALGEPAAPVSPPPPPPPAAKTTVPPPPPPPPAKPKPTGDALRLLTLLQADSRLLDFLMENFDGVKDEQVGAGVREVHKKAAAAPLKKYLVVEPVLSGADGERVTVAKGYDPSAVRVVGNVTGEPPYTGELQHPGWRVKELKLPAAADGQDPFVVQPAEVQV